jgi:hypothetical protein
MQGISCKVCNGEGHHPSKCPSLSGALGGGFSHENGTTGVSHDDEEDDTLEINNENGISLC